MIRTVLAVALAVALVGAATPALDAARTTRSERLTAAELDRVEAAADGLVREESPAKPNEPGPRRTIDLEIPGDSPTTAPVAYVALGGRPEESAAETDRSDLFAFRVAGGPDRIRRVGFDLRVGVRDDSDSLPHVEPDGLPVVLRGGGTYRLVLRLRESGGRPTVVLTVRGLKSRSATTSDHA